MHYRTSLFVCLTYLLSVCVFSKSGVEKHSFENMYRKSEDKENIPCRGGGGGLVPGAGAVFNAVGTMVRPSECFCGENVIMAGRRLCRTCSVLDG